MLLFRLALAAAVLTLVLAVGTAGARTQANVYSVQNLVSDTATTAPTTDPSLVNGWGLSAGPTTPWWTSNNGTNTTTLYNGSGAKQALTVTVPGGPTGTVFNGTAADFVVTQNGKTGSARFLFATEGGMILGWSPAVNATTAIPGVDHLSQGAVYKGLTTMSDRLYATDFHNGRVDVFDASFNPVPLAGGFQDAKLPKGFAPFGIQALAGNVFVTYAKQDAAKHDDVAGPGLGTLTSSRRTGSSSRASPRAGGRTLRRMRRGGSRSRRRPSACSRATCSSATSGTGASARTRTAAAAKWVYKGQLRLGDGTPLSVEGLWAIAFGNGAAAGPTTTLYALAGPGEGEARNARRDHLGRLTNRPSARSGRRPRSGGRPDRVDEIPVVLREEDGPLDLVAGERPDGVERVEQEDGDELGLVPVRSPQHQRAASLGRTGRRHPRLLHIGRVPRDRWRGLRRARHGRSRSSFTQSRVR